MTSIFRPADRKSQRARKGHRRAAALMSFVDEWEAAMNRGFAKTAQLHLHVRGMNVALGLLAISLVGLATPGQVLAGSGTDFVKVQEQWEVDLNTPSDARSAPQLTFLISPTGNTSGLYAVFVVNQRDGSAGGLELQLWNGETKIASQTHTSAASLATAGEKIQWTTVMTVSGNPSTLTVSVSGSSPSTWGNFDLSVSTATSMVNLNSYDLNISAENSGIDFGNTRVGKLIMKKVIKSTKLNGNSGDTTALGSDRVIYQYP